MKPDAEHVTIKTFMIKYGLHIIFILTSFKLFAQGEIPVGTWRTHFNYEKAIALENAVDKLYCLTSQGLFYYSLSENSTTKISKVDGLSDSDITTMAYNDELKLLSLGYANGNIDLVFENEIFNISTIKKSSIIENKRINHIAYKDAKVYLSTDFGVLVLNPNTGEIDETFQNLGSNGASIKILQVLFVNENIFLATNNGVLQADISANINLQDFNNWTRFDNSIVEGQEILSITEVGSNLFASSSSNIFEFSNDAWSTIAFNTSGESIQKLKKKNTNLLVILETSIQERLSNGSTTPLAMESSASPRDIWFEDEQTFWYADFTKGLTKSSNGNFERVSPNGIFSADVERLEFVNNSIMAFPKSALFRNVPQENGLGFAAFEDGSWVSTTTSEIFNIDDISDAVSLSEDNLILSSFGHGVIDLSTGVIYDETNSPLVNDNTIGRNVLVTSMESDSDANIWVGQIAQNSILKFTPEKNWEAFDLGITAARNPQNIKMDNLGQIWILPQSGFDGIVGFNPETQDVRHFTTSNSDLPDSDVNSFDFGENGQLWVATAGGLAYLPFTFGVLEDNSINFIEPVFENRILFDEQEIHAIEVDAGNRKWIATTDGLWLFEDDGDELIHNFNTDNSPLPSNQVSEIKANPITGEVFIATGNGLVSYRSDAVQGNAFHQTVKIFPNPVSPRYQGLVGFSGLANDVNLKITDVSGKLVREINTAGGGASWNVADYNGIRVQTGVYLVFSSNDDGTETFVGKVAVVN